MNEIELIHRQLATERLHFSAVANACAQVIRTRSAADGAEFLQACAEYFAFAIRRLNPATGMSLGREQGSRTLEASSSGIEAAAHRLTLARNDAGATASQEWRQFSEWFANEVRLRFAGFEDLKRHNLPVTEWRALARIDADSIFTERALYRRVEETLPARISLSDSNTP